MLTCFYPIFCCWVTCSSQRANDQDLEVGEGQERDQCMPKASNLPFASVLLRAHEDCFTVAVLEDL